MSNDQILEKLGRLQRAVEQAIASISYGQVRDMSPEDHFDHAQRYGLNAWVIGDFVILDRNAPPTPLPANPSDFDASIEHPEW